MDKLASLLAGYVYKNDGLSAFSYETYKYSFLIFLETLAGILTGCLAAVWLNLKWEMVIFLLTFGSLRLYAGGFHCKTFAKCYMGSACIMVSALCVIKYLRIAFPVSFTILLISIVILTLFRPANNDNRPIQEDEAVYFKKKLLKMEAVVLLVYLVFIKMDKIHYGEAIALAAAIVSVLMLVGRWVKQ